MMTLVESKAEFEITKRSMEDESEIKDAVFYNVTVPFVETFVLKNPGDFCISRTIDGAFYLSIVANKKDKKGGVRVVNLRVEDFEKEVGIPGLIFARADTLAQLIYQLKHENMDILSGVLEEKLTMNRLLGPQVTAMHNILQTGKSVKVQRKLSQDTTSPIYIGEMKFSDGKIKEAVFEEIPGGGQNPTELKTFFEKLVNSRTRNSRRGVNAKSLRGKNLPIRIPIGAIMNPPTLIYEFRRNNKLEVGCNLEDFLFFHQNRLDLTQRIKICSSAVRVLSELHHADIYHGASQLEHFYVDFVGLTNEDIKYYVLVFNGASGLICEGKSDNSVSVVDYDSTAPEVAFTRKLTKESGVFNLGRLFEQILKPDLFKSYSESNEGSPESLTEMRRLISRATHPNPTRRPTMHGIVMMIRDVLLKAPKSSSPICMIHFDQFTN
ncbi:hypothetical protein GCK72_002807 [Caenorhabditis remanei]|uniref:Protein kinase domain-containing protein n=1 Tax=Caenorhabditis remanei TaxID=31234 RepID=A0A6A5HX24_CAERE|nr:hypothetical protein GCK72_002807 [Caenorhabditis remanei]KAF1770983.1 hypothetical protein GCK72_002807 [Caenorhabditis remanei]